MGFRHGATMENLPDVLLLNIFTRLLAQQLAQTRCVSKSWNALLSQSSFIKSHLDRSIQNNKNDGIFLVFPRLFSFASKRTKPFTAHSYRSPILELPNFIKLSVNHQSGNRRGKVIGSVNGLICFKYGTNHDSYVIYGSNHDPLVIYIWNPSLSALLTLPPYFLPSHSIQLSFRFGFDPKSDDYKVVKITRHIEKLTTNAHSIKEWLPIEVYSMRNGSWKLITQMIPPHLSDIRDCDTLCVDGHDGHLHWIAESDYMGNLVFSIFTFDLAAYTFREIPLPVAVTNLMGDDNANDVIIDLGVMGGKLCVMALPDYQWEVWVMNEYGVAESWVKLHVFPPYRGGYYTYGYGFTLSNEFVIRVDRCGLALYDLVEAKTKLFKFGIDGGIKVVDYVDSIVWVIPDEQREMRCCSISQFQF